MRALAAPVRKRGNRGCLPSPLLYASAAQRKPELPVELSGVFELRRNPVAVAVGLVAQVRASSDDPGVPRAWSRGILSGAGDVEGGGEPVQAPLPHVARDVEEPEAVGRE